MAQLLERGVAPVRRDDRISSTSRSSRANSSTRAFASAPSASPGRSSGGGAIVTGTRSKPSTPPVETSTRSTNDRAVAGRWARRYSSLCAWNTKLPERVRDEALPRSLHALGNVGVMPSTSVAPERAKSGTPRGATSPGSP